MNDVFVSPPSTAFHTSVSIYSSPADGAQAGGDWCEVVPVSEHAVALVVGDVAGHGTPVAELMSAMRASALRACHTTRVPSDVLAIINGVADTSGDGMLVTAIVAILDHRRHTLTFANAGHPPPLLMTGGSHAFLQQSTSDLPLGVFPNHSAANYVVALPADALLVFYTDGITEHDRDPVLGEAELVAAARLMYGHPEPNVARAIAQLVFAGGRGQDDAATIALRTMPRHPR
ncbi:MAG: PP2C family protein-serine/threonine phosphatase [Vulcanimicrobiaceae bacterium]